MKSFSFLEEDYGFKNHGGEYAARYKDFYCVFTADANAEKKECALTVGAYKEGGEAALPDLLQPLTAIKNLKFEIAQATIIIKYETASALLAAKQNEKNKELFDEITGILFPILRNNNYQSGGFVHGNIDGSVRLAKLGSKYLFVTEAEFQELKSELQARKEDDKKQSENFLLGILGILGVALAGIVLYTLVGRLGYYVWAVPAFLAGGAASVYKKLAGKLTVKALGFMFVILTAALFAATFLEYTWRIYDVLKEEYVFSFYEIFEASFTIIFEETEVKKPFLRDLVINGVILIGCTIAIFITSYKAELRFQEISWVKE